MSGDAGDNFVLREHYYEYFRCLFREFGVLDPDTYEVKQEQLGQLLSGNSKINNETDRQFVASVSRCLHYDCIAMNCNITISTGVCEEDASAEEDLFI